MAAYRDLAEAYDRFAKEWESGRRPRLETYLDSVDEASRSQLLRSLLVLEVEMVRRSGTVPDVTAYRRRFPQYADVISEVFVQAGTKESPSRSTVATAETVAYKTNPGTLPANIGRFQILALLGEGAFGRVYRARDPELEREVAIKVPRLQSGDATFDVQQFLREAKAAATIQHPNVCPVYEAGVHEGQPYIVMAYIRGKSLAEVLQNRQPPPGKQVALIIRKLALALQAAHDKGVVHRDLKPSNILFDQNRRDVVVTDFGLARRDDLDDAGQTRSGVIMGTPAYMSPEQARGDSRSVGPAADIYALGVVLYELLTGERPFTGSAREVIDLVQDLDPLPPSARRPGVDPQLEEICLKAMAKKPADRYSSMRALAGTMQEYLRGGADEAGLNSATRTGTTVQDTTGFADLIANALAEQKAEMAAALEAAVSKARTPFWKILLPMGLLTVFGLVMLGLFLFTRPAVVPVTLQLDVDLKDKELSFFLDDKPIEAEKLAGPIEMTEGRHVLIVKRGETIIRRYEFEVKRGMDPIIRPENVAPPWPMSPGVPPATVHYPLDGSGQAMLSDSRRRASDGKVVGNVTSVAGVISQAAGLEGKADQYLEIQDIDALHITRLFTAAAWVKGKGNEGTLISRWSDKGYAFRITASEADGVEPKDDIAPAMMPAQTPPVVIPTQPAPAAPIPMNGEPKKATTRPPQAALPSPAALMVSSFTLLAQPLQQTQPARAKQKTSVIEFAVNFGAKDKADNAIVLRATYDPELWTHVAATFDGHFLRLFLNGYQAAELMLADDPSFRKLMVEGKASLPTSIASSTAPLVMGQGFNGQLDDVMLFDAALNSKELMRLIHFNTIRELASPPGQWVTLAAGESDLERARITGKLGENVNFGSSGIAARLELENKAEVQFPIKARNYIVRGTLNRIDAPGGNKQTHAALVRIRRDGANSYGGYLTPDGNLGLFKEIDGKIADLTSSKFSLTPVTFFKEKTFEERVGEQIHKVVKQFPVVGNNPVTLAMAVHGDRLAWFEYDRLLLERKDDAIKAGSIALCAVNEGAVWISDLQVCVLDGTPFTPEQALYLGRNRSSIKPTFTRLVTFDALNQMATFEDIVTEYKQETYTYTFMDKRHLKKTRTEIKTIDGKQVPTQVEYEEEVEVPVTKQGTRTVPLHKAVCYVEKIDGRRITDARGNPLKIADLVNRLKPGDACLNLSSDKLAPAYVYLMKAKPETVVFSQLPIGPMADTPETAAPPTEPKTMPSSGGIVAAPPVKPASDLKPRVAQLTGHANPIQTVIYSPDGSQIATADGTFWKPMSTLQLEQDRMSSGQSTVFPGSETGPDCPDYLVATRGDGTRLAVNQVGRLPVSIWDTATNKVVLTIPGGKQPLTALAFSSDGKWVASASQDYFRPFQQPQQAAPKPSQPLFELKIWDAVTGKQVHDLSGLTHRVMELAFSPDGRRLISSDESGTLRIWDAALGQEHLSIVNDEGIQTRSIAISNKVVALACSGRESSMIRLINPETGAQIIKIPAKPIKGEDGKNVPTYFSRVAFTDDGKKLITCESNMDKGTGSSYGWQEAQKDKSNTVRLFDADTVRELQQMDVGKVDRTIVVSPDGTHFAARYSPTTPDETIKVWYVATGQSISSIKGRFWSVPAVKNDGSQVFATRYVEKVNDYPPLSVKLWNASTGAQIHSFDVPGDGIVSISYSEDGKRLAAGISMIDKSQPDVFVGQLRVWETASGNEIKTINGLKGWVMGVALDREGKRLASCTPVATQVWNVETGKQLHSLPGGTRMAMDPAGKLLMVSGGFGPPPEAGKPVPKSVRIFNCDDGKELPGLTVPGSVNALAISHNGVVLATASSDGIRSWNLQTGQELRIFPANVGHLFFDAAGKKLTTANSRSTFTIRDASSGRAFNRLRLRPRVSADAPAADQMFAWEFGYDARGIPMSLSPDGSILAVVSIDGKSVQFKPVASLEPVGNEDIAPEEKVMKNIAPPSPVAPQPASAMPVEAKPTEPKPVGVLINGSFEESEKGWTSTSWRGNKSVAVIVSDVSKSGNAVRLRATASDDAGYWQEVSVKPKTRYRVSGWVRTEKVVVAEKGGTAGATISVAGGYESSPSSLGTTDWTLRFVEFNSGERIKVQVGGRLGSYGSTVTGTAWFDDIKLEELPNAALPAKK